MKNTPQTTYQIKELKVINTKVGEERIELRENFSKRGKNIKEVVRNEEL